MALPVPRAFWPLTVSTSNRAIDVVVGGNTYAAQIATGVYYDPITLADAVAAALTAQAANDWDCTVSAQGRVTVTGTAAFSLRFSTGANVATSARDVLGFGDVDTASATSATGTYQHQNGWYGDDPVVDDTGWLPAYQRGLSVALAGQSSALNFGTRYQRVITLGFLAGWKTWKAEESSHLNEAIERLWDDGWMRFRWWADGLVDGTYVDMLLAIESAKGMTRERLSHGSALYALTLRCWRYLGGDGTGAVGDGSFDGGTGLY